MVIPVTILSRVPLSDLKQDRLGPVGLSQRGRLGFLLRDSVLYGGAGALSKAFALITFPLLARHFSVGDYGVLDFFLVLVSVTTLLFIFGQDSAVARYFYEHEEAAERRQIVSQSLVFQLVGVAVFWPLLWLWSAPLSAVLLDSRDTQSLFRIVLLQLPFALLINFAQNILKWTFDRKKFLLMSLGFTTVQAILLVATVSVLDVGIAGVLLVSLSTSVCFGLLGVVFVRRWLVWPRDLRYLRVLLPFAAPYGLICVMGACSPTLERTLIIQLLDAESLGLYAAGAKAAMLIGLLVTAFQTAWGPFSLSIYKQSDAGVTYNLVLKFFSIGMCVSVFALSIIAYPLIYFLASDRFTGAVVVVFPLTMALAIQATSWITEVGIGLAKRTHLNLYGHAASLAVTFGAIELLAPLVGLPGVGVGVLLGQATKAVVASWLAQRAYALPWGFLPVLGLFAFALTAGGAGMVAMQLFGVLAYSGAMAVALGGTVLIGWILVFDSDDRVRIMSTVLAIRTGLHLFR